MATKTELARLAEETATQPDPNGSTALAVPSASGVHALAMMTDEQFDARMEQMKIGLKRNARVQKDYMVEGVDYGTIQGIDKPTIFKPGAEKLMQLYGIVARIESRFVAGDNQTAPALTYDSTCFLHVGSFDGPIVGMGHGTANSWEKRYRRESKVCPNCGKTDTIIRGKAEYGGGWLCWQKKNGCGTKYATDDPAITGQASNAGNAMEAYDLGVTLMKMSEKRSITDGVLRATATSGLFTQDVAEEALPDVALPDVAPSSLYQDSTYAEEPAATVRHEPNPEPAEDNSSQAQTQAYTQETLEAIAAVSGGEVVVGPSAVPDVGRGGRTEGANEAQINEVRRLANELQWGSKALLSYCYAMFEAHEPEVPEDGRVARGVLTAYLEAMSAADMGRLVQSMNTDLELIQSNAAQVADTDG